MQSVIKMGMVAVCVGCLWLTGCGGGEEQGGAATVGSAAVSAAVKPGKPIKGDKQLIGRWYGQNPGSEFAGLEFTDTGKVLITLATRSPMQLGGTVTWDYEAIDGGRVRMTLPNGVTHIFTAAINSKTLTLANDRTPEQAMRFNALGEQTIAEAHREAAQRLVEQHQARKAAVNAFLKQEHLALVSNDPTLRVSRQALTLQGGPENWSGVAYTDLPSPTLREARVSVVDAGPGNPIQLRIDWTQTLGPPGQFPLKPDAEVFAVEGEPGSLQVVSALQRKLVSDQQVHSELIKGYQALKEKREAEIAKLVDQFGQYAWLQGGYHYQSSKGPYHQQLGLVLRKVEGKSAFEYVEVHRAQQPNWNQNFQFNAYQLVQVAYNMGKPMLMLPGPWFLEPVEEDGKLVFKGQNRSNQDALFEIAQTFTQKQMDERAAAIEAYLDTFASGRVLRGRVLTSGSNGHFGGRVFDLTIDAARNVTGTMKVLEYGGTYSMVGKAGRTFRGASIQLQATGVSNEPYNQMMRGNVKVDLIFDFDAGTVQQPMIVGQVNGGYLSGDLAFAAGGGELEAAEREQILTKLRDGASFAVVRPNTNQRRVQPVYTLKLDPATRKITGRVNDHGNHLFAGDTAITGELSERDGFVFLHLLMPATTRDSGANNRPTEQYLWALPEDDSFVLAGATFAPGEAESGKYNPKPFVLVAGE